MGYGMEELIRKTQNVEGMVIALEDDPKIRPGLAMTLFIAFDFDQVDLELMRGRQKPIAATGAEDAVCVGPMAPPVGRLERGQAVGHPSPAVAQYWLNPRRFTRKRENIGIQALVDRPNSTRRMRE
jgi:hypothetical protein